MKKFVIILLCLLLARAAGWYFMRDKSSARDVLPADATAVIVFEPAELMSGLGLTTDDLKSLAKVLPNGEESFSAADLSKPIYTFVSESGTTGIAMDVNDEGKLLKVLEEQGCNIEEQRGFHWFTVSNGLGCVGKDKMLLFTPVSGTEQDALRGEMVKLMTQSRQDVVLLEKAEKQKGLLKLSIAMSNLPKKYLDKLPEGTDLSNTYLNAAFSIGNEDLTFALNFEGSDEMTLPLEAIKGSLTGMQPEEPFIWLSANMKGEQLLPHMRNIPELRSALLALNLCVDADMMLKAIDGDIMLAIPTADFEHPNFLLTATLANTDFLANKNDWQVARRSDTDFSIKGNTGEVFFGVRDGRLYIATTAELADKACQEANANALQQAAKGKYLSAALDVSQIFKAYPSYALMLRAVPQIYDTVDAIDQVVLSSNTQRNVELSIRTKKPIKDIVEKIMELAKK